MDLESILVGVRGFKSHPSHTYRIERKYSMEHYEEEKVVMSIAILVIFITIVLTIMVYFGKI